MGVGAGQCCCCCRKYVDPTVLEACGTGSGDLFCNRLASVDVVPCRSGNRPAPRNRRRGLAGVGVWAYRTDPRSVDERTHAGRGARDGALCSLDARNLWRLGGPGLSWLHCPKLWGSSRLDDLSDTAARQCGALALVGKTPAGGGERSSDDP